jgi:hypothetical protein
MKSTLRQTIGKILIVHERKSPLGEVPRRVADEIIAVRGDRESFGAGKTDQPAIPVLIARTGYQRPCRISR